MNHTTGKYQLFSDTRLGWSATLRVDVYQGFWLRIYQPDGLLREKSLFPTALMAKSYLEQVLLCSAEFPKGMRGNWWTVKGYVCDITN